MVPARLHLSPEHLCQFRCDGLLALPTLGLRYLQSQFLQVEMLESSSQDFAMAHRGVQAKSNKQPATRIIICQRASEQGVRLLVGQRKNAALFALQKLDLAGSD